MSLRPVAVVLLLCLAGAAAADEPAGPTFDKKPASKLSGSAALTGSGAANGDSADRGPDALLRPVCRNRVGASSYRRLVAQ